MKELLKKLWGYVKQGPELAIRFLPLARPYLVAEIQKVQGKIGDTPEEQADWVMARIAEGLKKLASKSA